MAVWDSIDRVVCINLPHRTDRRRQAEEQFAKVGLLDRVYFLDADQHKDGRIGLQNSLLGIFEESEGRGYGAYDHVRNILVFEDDVLFTGVDPLETFEKAWGDIEFYYPDFDLLYLGANLTRPVYPVTPNLALVEGALAAHAVLYSDNIFQDYIDHLQRVVTQGEIKSQDDISDVFLTKIQDRGRSFVVQPKIAIQRPSWSDIENRFTDYTQIL